MEAASLLNKFGTSFRLSKCDTGFQLNNSGTGFQMTKCGTGFQPVIHQRMPRCQRGQTPLAPTGDTTPNISGVNGRR